MVPRLGRICYADLILFDVAAALKIMSCCSLHTGNPHNVEQLPLNHEMQHSDARTVHVAWLLALEVRRDANAQGSSSPSELPLL